MTNTLERIRGKKQDSFNAVNHSAENLQALLSQLAKAKKSSSHRHEIYGNSVTTWETRFKQAQIAVGYAEKNKPEAVASLTILFNQAEKYLLGYQQKLKSEGEYAQNLTSNIDKISETLHQLKSVDKLSTLDEKLRRLTAGTDIYDGNTVTLDDREIRQTLYTAQALIELHTQKEIES